MQLKVSRCGMKKGRETKRYQNRLLAMEGELHCHNVYFFAIIWGISLNVDLELSAAEGLCLRIVFHLHITDDIMSLWKDKNFLMRLAKISVSPKTYWGELLFQGVGDGFR